MPDKDDPKARPLVPTPTSSDQAASDQGTPTSGLALGEGSASYPIEKLTRDRRPGPIFSEHGGRVPPQAINVERAILGAMMLEADAIAPAIELIVADAFYDPKHRKVFEAMCNLFGRGHPVDVLTVSDELKRLGSLDSVGGSYFLSQLTADISTAANIEHHARIVVEKSLLRELIGTMTRLVGVAYDPASDAFEVLDKAEREIFDISDNQLRRSSRSMGEILKETLHRLEAIHGQDGGITGTASGFHRLDQYTSGFQPSDLIVIAARPSMGENSLRVACCPKHRPRPEKQEGCADILVGNERNPARPTPAYGRSPNRCPGRPELVACTTTTGPTSPEPPAG